MAVTAQERKLLLDGEWIETGEWHEVRSPYSGETVARVPQAGADHARRAVDAAAKAMENPLPAHHRAEILDRVATLLRERQDDVAQTICAEAAKPLKAARVEAERAVSTFTMAAVEARRLAGAMVPMDASPAGVGKLAYTLRVPIGVVGAITPFNFPLNLVCHKVAPALAAGCAVVLKPAGQTPLSALLLAELETEAGLPAGWLNVLVGPSAEIGDVLVDDEHVSNLRGGPDEDVEPAGGQSGFRLQLGEEEGGERSLSGGLQDDGAARGERRRDLVPDEVERKVEGSDRADDTDGDAERVRELADAGGGGIHRDHCPGETARFDRGHRERRDSPLRLYSGCFQRLGRLRANGLGDVVLALPEESRHTVKDFRAVMCRQWVLHRFRGRVDRPARMVGARLRNSRDRLARVRRAHLVPLASLDPLAVEEELALLSRDRHTAIQSVRSGS